MSSDYFSNFFSEVTERSARFIKTIIGDYSYEPKKKLSNQKRQKILKYLQSKYYTLESKLREQKPLKYTSYDKELLNRQCNTLSQMKELLMMGKTNIEAASDRLKQLEISRQLIKCNFLNEVAFEFDRQRYVSLAGGGLFGCLINSTIYTTGSTVRRIAVVVTMMHLFGQTAYYLSINKYFDSVYTIFEQDAIQFQKADQNLSSQNMVSQQSPIILRQ